MSTHHLCQSTQWLPRASQPCGGQGPGVRRDKHGLRSVGRVGLVRPRHVGGHGGGEGGHSCPTAGDGRAKILGNCTPKTKTKSKQNQKKQRVERHIVALSMHHTHAHAHPILANTRATNHNTQHQTQNPNQAHNTCIQMYKRSVCRITATMWATAGAGPCHSTPPGPPPARARWSSIASYCRRLVSSPSVACASCTSRYCSAAAAFSASAARHGPGTVHRNRGINSTGEC